MADKLTGPRTPSDLTDRRKELIYCDGYDSTDGVTAFTSDPNNNETDIAVFGSDDNIAATNTTSANVNLTILEQNEKLNAFMRLIHGMRPDNNPLNTPKQYESNDLEEVNMLVLRKNNSDDKIVASRFYRTVQFSSSWPEGGPDDKSQRMFTGKGVPAREFDGLITCDLIASGGGTLRSTPFEVPGEASGVYAVHIEMVFYPGGDLSVDNADREPIKKVDANMVSSAGVVDWPSCVSAVGMGEVPNRAHVYYLLSGASGIPETTSTIAPQGMRGAPGS